METLLSFRDLLLTEMFAFRVGAGRFWDFVCSILGRGGGGGGF